MLDKLGNQKKETKCKHDLGWLVKDVRYLFIFDGDNDIAFSGDNRGAKSHKFKAVCNRPDCNASRNVYIKAHLVKFGKIKEGE